MRTLSALCLLLCAFLAGCESVPERFAAVPPQVLTVDGDVETVYPAAQKAFKRLGFALTRTSMGRVEAASAINTSVTMGDSRQIVARLAIRAAEPGKSAVELSLTEEVTSDSMGGSRKVGLRQHSFYQSYFAMLQQVLSEKAN